MGQERVHFLDWLKVLIVYGIVVFHVALVFTFGTWLVTNRDQSVILSGFVAFTFPWGIPAMFLIAGADAWFGLRRRSLHEFVNERFLRLLVPMIPGLLLLSPLQRFVTSHNPPPPIQQLPAYYVDFFRGFHFEWTLQWVSQYWLHMWFLGYLFAISVACGPFVVWLRMPAGRRLTAGLLEIANRRGGLILFAAPLLITQLVLRPRFPAYQDWADVATYTLAFAWGAVLFSDRRFEAAIRREIKALLLVGMLAVLGLALLLATAPTHKLGDPHTPAAVQGAYALFWTFDVWAWLLAVLYLGIRWFDFPSRAQVYLRESVLPIYVIHHPYVLVVSSFVVTWGIGIWPKFAVILAAVFALTLGTYELGIRRWSTMRLLFGLSPSRSATSSSRRLDAPPERSDLPEEAGPVELLS